jgi:hypothetical protein
MFVNNPLDIVVGIVTKKYPLLDAEIWFADYDKLIHGLGFTQFPEKRKDPIKITINVDQTMIQCTDVLAHELAHAIAGQKAKHSKKWKKVYDWINDRYCEEVEKI